MHASVFEECELVAGQWRLIPFFAKSPRPSYQTNNARSEELAAKATFRDPRKRGQRCIIPARSFDEPNWESGKTVWWSFRPTDGQRWGLAGRWNTWKDKDTGELVESFTMLTLNADAHPLMSRMHKLDPKVAPEQHDKRSVVLLESTDWDVWLRAPLDEAQQLIRLACVEMFNAEPSPEGAR